MTATTAIAIYAAVLSTAGLAWQVFSWAHRRRSHVTVQARIAFVGYDALQVISIEATNTSDHPVRVTSAGLMLQDGSGRQFVILRQPDGATLPGVVQPHDSATTWIAQADAESEGGFDVFAPVTAWVNLATGQAVTSKPRPLMTR